MSELIGLGGSSNTFGNPTLSINNIKGLGGSSNTFVQFSFPFSLVKGLKASSNTFTLDLSKFSKQTISKNYQI